MGHLTGFQARRELMWAGFVIAEALAVRSAATDSDPWLIVVAL
jgi:hypothetical protein